jgi:nitrogen fixation protein FixH
MKRGQAWPIGITLLLTIFVAANLVVMRIAGADPSFAVEPDYYAKAMTFDSTMALERESARLGWTAASWIVPRDGATMLVVTLTDAKGAAVAGAMVVSEARFVGRAAKVLRDTLAETGRGQYEATLVDPPGGAWEVRVAATRGAERFVATTRTTAPRRP